MGVNVYVALLNYSLKFGHKSWKGRTPCSVTFRETVKICYRLLDVPILYQMQLVLSRSSILYLYLEHYFLSGPPSEFEEIGSRINLQHNSGEISFRWKRPYDISKIARWIRFDVNVLNQTSSIRNMVKNTAIFVEELLIPIMLRFGIDH